ncbi:MAG TPA: MBL fold metallo-hydrolase, partial [candidate division Zixibacteria bacterium]|nr:MBL fold metallo-hydrolase [candidate division Zixibacteria bacterium]
GFGRLKYIADVEESKALNDLTTPAIIISASGMAEGGRILHHLKNNIENHRNLILFVGYAAQETLARRIMDGDKVVKIFGEEYQVRAQVKSMDVFSAHGDKNDLINFAKASKPEKLKNIFLVHGEPEQALPLRDNLKSRGYINVEFPAPGALYEV